MNSPDDLSISPLWVLPLWAIFFLVAGMLLLSHRLGVELRRRIGRGHDTDEVIGGTYLSASLGLLALLVGFSFGMAVDRYNNRRGLVVQEANAISTVHRRLQALGDPGRSLLIPKFVGYVDAREAFSRASTTDQIRDAERRTDQQEEAFWSLVLLTLENDGDGDNRHAALSAHGAVDSMINLFNLAASRRDGIEAVIPRTILVALLAYAGVAAIFLGYSHPLGRRHFLASSIQFVLLAMAFALIIDLDRPRTGFVEVTQSPLYRAAAAVRADPANAAPAPPRTP